jgi:hypothetical protein
MSIDVSEVLAASIIRAMMEAARTSETSVDIQLRTRQYIPEDSELQNVPYQTTASVHSEQIKEWKNLPWVNINILNNEFKVNFCTYTLWMLCMHL